MVKFILKHLFTFFPKKNPPQLQRPDLLVLQEHAVTENLNVRLEMSALSTHGSVTKSKTVKTDLMKKIVTVSYLS